MTEHYINARTTVTPHESETGASLLIRTPGQPPVMIVAPDRDALLRLTGCCERSLGEPVSLAAFGAQIRDLVRQLSSDWSPRP